MKSSEARKEKKRRRKTMMGPRNDGRTDWLDLPSLSLSYSLYRSISDRRGGAGGLSKSREERAEERQLYSSSPFPSFLVPPPSTSIGKVSLSRVVCTRTRTPYGGRGGEGGERERKREGRKRKNGGPRKEGGAQINFLDPLRGGRATNRPRDRARTKTP